MADELDLFTGSREPVKLFEVLRDQCQPDHPWPILYIIGPRGAGKTTVTKHLHREMRHSVFPHIRINFQHENVPRQPLQLLVTIRDEFHRHVDANGSSLRFPLFDFGAALIRAAQQHGNAVLSPDEAVEQIYRNSDILNRWMEPTGALGNQITIVPALMIVLKNALDLDPISRFMQRLRDGVVWKWYKQQASRLNLSSDQDIKILMERLYELARDDGNEELLEELLAEALFADLAAAFAPDDPEAPHPWPGAHRAVVFLDSFDVLINTSATDAERVLELLSLYMPVRRGAPTALLLVVASELPFNGAPLQVRHPLKYNEEDMLHYAQNRFADWLRTLPRPYSRVKLSDLLWSVELHSFDLAETRSYLLNYGRKYNLSIFRDDKLLIEHIHKLTYGYPACVHLVARAAQRTGHLSYADNLGTLLSGNRTIADDLYERFMQPSGQELFDQEFREQLILCALPLALDKGLLSELLESRNYIRIDHLWRRLLRLSFVNIRKDNKIVFQPIVRMLLLTRFKPEGINRDYFPSHERLEQYFERHNPQHAESLLSRAYHALLQGKVDAALELGRQLFRQDQNRWRDLLTAVKDVPFGPGHFAVGRLPVGQRAVQSETRFQETENGEDGADAILLYRWLLTEPLTDQEKETCWRGLAVCSPRMNGAVKQEDVIEAVDHALKSDYRRVNAQVSLSSGGSTITQQGTISLPGSGSVSPAGPIGGGNGGGTRGVPVSPPLSQPSRPPSASSTRPLVTNPMQIRSLINIRRFFGRRGRRRSGSRNIFLFLSIVITVIAIFLCPIMQATVQNDVVAFLFPPSRIIPTPILISSPPTPSLHNPDKNGMGVTVQANGEYTGLSDGSFPFDIAGRPDSLHKTLASNAFLRNDLKSAIAFWNKAVGSSASSKDNDDESNDAEIQIYLQNQMVSDRCVGVVVATDLSHNTGSGVTIGRDELQGAYLVQRAQNDSPDPLKICLYIANMGNDPRNANGVAQQIVQAMPKYRIKAVVGWPTVDSAKDALQTLYNAHLPVVSADAYQHQRDALPNLFHSIPSSETEGQQDALYVEHTSQAQRVALLSSANEKSDSYSTGLKNGFVQQLHNDGKYGLVVDTKQYKGNDFAAIMKQIARKKPDLIYFTGGIDDALSMLANLALGQFSDHLRVLGGHKLYQLVGYSNLQPSGIQFLDFSSSGYPDQESVLPMKQHYAEYFDKGDSNSNSPRVYGYSRPDNDVISSYNAMNVLLVALRSLGSSSQFQPAQVMDALKQNPFQLIGTQDMTTTTFNEFNEPAKLSLLIIHVDKDRHLQANLLIS